MPSNRRRRTLVPFACLVLVATVAFLVTLWLPRTAEAMPDVEVIYTYYSDASLTTIVGTRYWSCSGLEQWGVVTEYVVRSEGLDCPNYYCKEVWIDPADPTQGTQTECGWY